ncbi:MAG TPA: ABC transporter permease [Intrasporangiaceae bacterium]|nr:ABC transporter permease [Intrasporangiaceae bacterium]
MSTTTTSTSTSRAWALVARREILVKAVDKGFIIGTLLTLAILGGWLGWTAYSAERTNMYAVVTTSADAAMGEQVAERASHLNDKTVVETRTVADADAATAEVDSGAADGWLHRDGTGWTLTTKSSKGELLSVTQQAVRGATIDDQAKALGTTAADLEAGSVVSPHFLEGDAERAGLAQAVGFAMALLFFMAALMYGMQIAYSVVEEKQSRIVEIIATSIPLRHLLAGKVLGNTVMAILQMVLYIGVGLIGLSFTPYKAFIPALTGPVAWFIVFFTTGFIALACLWAVAGSLASRMEDLQSTSAPLTYLIMGIYFGSFLLSGNAKVIASFVPPVSAVIMPMRILEGGVPLWQPIVALALMLAFGVATIIIGERLYRRSLLQSGGRVSLKAAWSAAE